MTDDARVIRFPTWRRQAVGAPGVESDRETGPRTPDREAMPPPDGIDRLDAPVWHEGDSTTGDVVVRLRADLLGVRPPVWRRLEIRGSLTLDAVHPVLAAAFGWPWEGEHRFREVLREECGTRLGATLVNAWTRGRAHGPEEWSVPLGRLLATPRSRLRYVYGRGRGFELTIVAEDVAPVPPAAAGEVPAARLLTGRRQGPPASVGTTAAYALLLEGRTDRGRDGAELMNVPVPAEIEGDFDPDRADLDVLAARVRAAGEAADA